MPISKKPKHWLIVAIILVAIVVIGIIFILLLNSQKSSLPPPSSISPTAPFQPSPAQDETENWETYQNNVYKFSLKYPKGWLVDDRSSDIPIITLKPYKNSGSFLSIGPLGLGFQIETIFAKGNPKIV